MADVDENTPNQDSADVAEHPEEGLETYKKRYADIQEYNRKLTEERKTLQAQMDEINAERTKLRDFVQDVRPYWDDYAKWHAAGRPTANAQKAQEPEPDAFNEEYDPQSRRFKQIESRLKEVDTDREAFKKALAERDALLAAKEQQFMAYTGLHHKLMEINMRNLNNPDYSQQALIKKAQDLKTADLDYAYKELYGEKERQAEVDRRVKEALEKEKQKAQNEAMRVEAGIVSAKTSLRLPKKSEMSVKETPTDAMRSFQADREIKKVNSIQKAKEEALRKFGREEF